MYTTNFSKFNLILFIPAFQSKNKITLNKKGLVPGLLKYNNNNTQ